MATGIRLRKEVFNAIVYILLQVFNSLRVRVSMYRAQFKDEYYSRPFILCIFVILKHILVHFGWILQNMIVIFSVPHLTKQKPLMKHSYICLFIALSITENLRNYYTN